MGDETGAMPRAAQRQTRAQMIADKLKLNKSQKEDLEKILIGCAQEAMPLRTQMDQARAQLAGALIDGKGEDEVNKQQQAYGELVAKMDGLEAQAFAKIYAMLKPNQQSKADQAFELMAGIFVQAGRGGAGGGAGRGERNR